MKRPGLTKRKSLVLVIGTNKVFLRPNGVIISLRRRFRDWVARKKFRLDGLDEAQVFGFTRLNNFDFLVELRYQSAIWTVYLGVYPFLKLLINP